MAGTDGSTEAEPGSATGRIAVTLTGDRRDVEAMSLEFRRLAKEYGVGIGDLRVLPVPPRQDSAGSEIQAERASAASA